MALQVRWRAGWHRIHQPVFHEYRIDLHSLLRCRWVLRLSFEHTQVDNRWTAGVNLSGVGKKMWTELRRFAQGRSPAYDEPTLGRTQPPVEGTDSLGRSHN